MAFLLIEYSWISLNASICLNPPFSCSWCSSHLDCALWSLLFLSSCVTGLLCISVITTLFLMDCHRKSEKQCKSLINNADLPTVSFGSSCEGLIKFGYFVLIDVLILIIENPTIMLLISKHYGNKRLYLKKNILKKLKRVCILKGFTFHPLLRIWILIFVKAISFAWTLPQITLVSMHNNRKKDSPQENPTPRP